EINIASLSQTRIHTFGIGGIVKKIKATRLSNRHHSIFHVCESFFFCSKRLVVIMKSVVPNTLFSFLFLFLLAVNIPQAEAQGTAPASPNAAGGTTPIQVKIGYLRAYAPELALSVLDIPPRDAGVAGAKVAIDDNNTTGSFLGQEFSLDVVEIEPGADAVEPFTQMVEDGA